MSLGLLLPGLLFLSAWSTVNSVYYESHQLAQAVVLAPLQQVERSARWVLREIQSFR